jgi:uncharacterized protein (TIGR00297 family)
MLIGGTLAGLAANRAARHGQLTMGGEYAAFGVGTAAAIGGVGWAVSLGIFFYSSVRISRWRGNEKRRRSDSVLPEARARDALQVLANGGLFAMAALSWGLFGWWQAGLFGFGALAAATADTWATEVGMAIGGEPRSILTLHRVTPGTSGGISVLGSGAAVAGAFLIALAAVVSFTTPFDLPLLEAVLAGGLAGTLTDSLLGASVQSRRWCDSCNSWTERRVHTCGYRTHHRRGVRWVTNDTVNLLATAAGGIAAMGIWSWQP